MAVTRRSFLKAGSLAAVCAGVPIAVAKGATGQPGGVANPASAHTGGAVDLFSSSSFSAHLNTKFRVRLKDARVVDLTLIEVEDSRHRRLARNGKGESFSLRFSVPRDEGFAQGIHAFQHDALGKFSLFIARVDREKRLLTYEAIIDRT
jgi:hypothetical protein